jgi:hypothetical protein
MSPVAIPSDVKSRRWTVTFALGDMAATRAAACLPFSMSRTAGTIDAPRAARTRALAAQFEHVGVAPGRAPVLAGLATSTLEGTPVLSRAARSIEPFNTTVEALSAIEGRGAADPAER